MRFRQSAPTRAATMTTKHTARVIKLSGCIGAGSALIWNGGGGILPSPGPPCGIPPGGGGGISPSGNPSGAGCSAIDGVSGLSEDSPSAIGGILPGGSGIWPIAVISSDEPSMSFEGSRL